MRVDRTAFEPVTEDADAEIDALTIRPLCSLLFGMTHIVLCPNHSTTVGTLFLHHLPLPARGVAAAAEYR